MYYRSLPLVKKAGVTTGLLHEDYERDLAMGRRPKEGVRHQAQLSLSRGSVGSVPVSYVVAAFVLGIGLGVCSSRVFKQRLR